MPKSISLIKKYNMIDTFPIKTYSSTNRLLLLEGMVFVCPNFYDCKEDEKKNKLI